MPQHELDQNYLPKVGPQWSEIGEKQRLIEEKIKKFQIEPHLKARINRNIPGLRKKNIAFSRRPNNRRWYRAFSSFEKNGILNWGLSSNYVRFTFPIMPLFFFCYMCQPLLHGTVYIRENANFQWDNIYPKMGLNRPPYSDNTITRVA